MFGVLKTVILTVLSWCLKNSDFNSFAISDKSVQNVNAASREMSQVSGFAKHGF